MATNLSHLWGNWHDYFKAVRDARAEVSDDETLHDEPDVLTQPWTPALVSSAPMGVKRFAKRLEDAGWEVFCENAITHVGRVFYKSTDRAGEVRTEAHDVTTWQVRARRVQGGTFVAAVLASWEQKKSAAFDYARTWDCVTQEKEFYTKMADMNGWLDILAPATKKEKRAA